MRSIALDVHRDFCEVAIKDESGLRLGRPRQELASRSSSCSRRASRPMTRWRSRRPGRRSRSRGSSSHTSGAWWSPTRASCAAIAESKVKTDKVDAQHAVRAARGGVPAGGVVAR